MGACRYLDAATRGIELGLGFGSRHWAAASISRETGTIAIVVSESAVVRIFKHGQLRAEILPELWLLGHYGRRGNVERHEQEQLAIVTPHS
jgi:DNA integrity scanning protein DisA with diadenylate cyclase activity